MFARTIKSILRLTVIAVALWAAVWIGEVWELRAHPKQGVLVYLSGLEAPITGELSRLWSGDYMLTEPSGKIFTFDRGDIRVMAYSPAAIPGASNQGGLWYAWRGIFPFAFVVCVLGVLRYGRALKRKAQSASV